MVEAATRTSKSTVLSDDTKKSSVAFDVRSWQGLTKILKAGRNAFDSDEYAIFRDTVLQYAQSGGDPELKKEIDIAISHLPIGINKVEKSILKENISSRPSERKLRVPDKNVHKPKIKQNKLKEQNEEVTQKPDVQTDNNDVPHIGITRPQPAFVSTIQKKFPSQVEIKTTASSFIEENKIVKEIQTPVVKKPSSLLPTSVSAQNQVPTPRERLVPKVSAAKAQTVTAQVAPAPNPYPSLVPSVPPIMQNPQPQIQATPVVVENIQPTASISSGGCEVKTIDDYKSRIIEIKRTVNAQFGNPVTLIDSGNAAGREYMTSLLDAMKATGGSAPGTLLVAMNRLETAFTNIVKSTPPNVVSETPVAEIMQSQVQQTSIPVHAQKPSETRQNTQSQSQSQPPSAPVPPVSQLAAVLSPTIQTPLGIPAQPPVQTSTFQQQPTVPIAPPVVVATPASVVSLQPAVPQAPVTAVSIPSVLPSLADLQKMNDTSAVQSSSVTEAPTTQLRSAVSVATEPDFIPRKNAAEALLNKKQSKGVVIEKVLDPYGIQGELVTTGLKNLLNEWTVFGASGVLGTGPVGIDHPLYIQLSSMAMGVVISGRFQNSSSEIVKSIQDYTDAWRHEQGISYTQIETFDHYLRRVIRRILKRQNGISDAY